LDVILPLMNYQYFWTKAKTLLPTLIARGLGSVAQLALNIVIGRWFGSALTGLYYLYINWTNFLSTVSNLGLPTLILRKVPVYDQQEDKLASSELIIYSISFSALVTVLFSLVVSLTAPYWADLAFKDPSIDGQTVIIYASMGAFILNIARISFEEMKARKRLNLALTLEFSAPQLLFLSFLIGVVVLSNQKHLTGENYLQAYTIVLLPFLIVVIALCIKAMKLVQFNIERWKYTIIRLWQGDLRSIWGTTIGNHFMTLSPYLIMPFFMPIEEIGFFSVVHRLIGLTLTFNFALMGYYGPLFSKSYYLLDTTTLKKLYKEAQIVVLLTNGGMLLIFILFPYWVLSVFGQEFAQEQNCFLLRVVAMLRFINVFFGLSEVFLNMVGKAYMEFRSVLIAGISFIVIGIFLGSEYGMIGIGVAFGATSIIRGVISYWSVRKVLSFSK
jgi:O-antigen/teichoic acid export membrane protein